jgi:hypothetical protein
MFSRRRNLFKRGEIGDARPQDLKTGPRVRLSCLVDAARHFPHCLLRHLVPDVMAENSVAVPLQMNTSKE